MDADACVPQVSSRDRDLNNFWGSDREAPDVRRGAVAERYAWAASQHGPMLSRENHRNAVPEEIDTAVKGMKPAALKPVPDRAAAQSRSHELLMRDHAPLACRDGRQSRIATVFGDLSTTVVHNSPETRIHPTFLAHCAPRGHASEPLLYCQTHNCNQPHQAVTDTP